MIEAASSGRLSIAVAVVSVVAFYAVIVTIRMQQYDALWFAHIGHQFLTTSDRSSVLRPSLGWQSPVGYDGQYYFAVAADPDHARYYIGGNAGIVYSRILYPALVGVVSLGSFHALPYAMLFVNVVAAVVGTLAIALWLRQRGAPAWLAGLYGLFPGLIFTVLRDLTEPLAFALVALAALAYDERSTRRLGASAMLFALALLTRETVLPFMFAAAGALVVADARRFGRWSARAWSRAAVFTAAAALPLLLWRAFVASWLGLPTQETGGSRWAVPFHGILSYWPWDAQHWLIVLTIVLPALAAGAGAVTMLQRGIAPVAALLLLANVLLYVVFLPSGVDVDYGAAGRAAVGVVLAAFYCVPAWWRLGTLRRAGVVAGGFSWSLGWYLAAAALFGLSGMHLIST